MPVLSTIDVVDFDAAKAKDVHAVLNNYGLSISSLGYYPNPLDPDPEHRDTVIGHLKKVILAAELLEVEVVGTFVGRDKDKNIPDNLEAFAKIWPPIVKFAAEHQVKIAHRKLPDDLLLR